MLVIEEMMIPYINIKKPSTFRSENSRTTKDTKINFSGLTRKTYLITYCNNPNSQNLPLTQKVNSIKLSTKRKVLSVFNHFVGLTLKGLNAYFFRIFFHFGIEKTFAPKMEKSNL